MTYKKFQLIAILALVTTGILSSEASAGPSLVGISLNWKSIECLSILKGLAKKDAPSTMVECQANIVESSLQCVNKGGNADTANSEIFQFENVVLTTSVSANSCQLDKSTGRWYCAEAISDEDIETALGLDNVQCGPNPNFTYQLDVVTKMCAVVKVRDSAGSLLDAVYARCTLAPNSPDNTPFNCTEINETQFNDCSINDF